MTRFEEVGLTKWTSEDVYDWLWGNDSSFEGVDCDQQYLHLRAKDLAGPIFLAILSAFGIIGNLALFCVILYTPQMRTVANILIINLTIGDLFYIICTAPFYIERELFPCMDEPLWACRIQSFFPIVGQGGCVYSLAALSRERYGAIVHGIQARQRSGKLRNAFTVCLVWVASCLTGIPVLILANKYGQQCLSLQQFSTMAKAYETYRFFFLYLIPLIFIAVYYARMAQTLFKSTRGFGDNRTGNHQTEARKRLAIIILIVTVFFGVFWFPYYVYILWFQFAYEHYSKFEFGIATVFRNLATIMALTNSSLNPWCVFVMSSGHRRRLVQCLCCGRFGRTDTSKTPTSTSQCGGTRRRGSGGVSFTQVTTTPL